MTAALGRTRVLAAGAVVLAAVALLTPTSGASGGSTPADSPRRLLVFSVPGLTWSESERTALPALDGFFADAALADLAARSVAHRSGPGEAYLTIAAGTRATSDELVDGQVLAVDERHEGQAAGQIFERRTGVTPRGEFVSLGWPSLVGVNDDEPYDAVLGLLGETLADEGIGTAVVANADGSDLPGPAHARHAGLALAGTDGVLEDGELRSDLLVDDPIRPFGTRLDRDRALESFRDVWIPADTDDRSVVMVEASDLARTMRYRPLVDADRYRELRADALDDADSLFEGLLAEVDPEQDAVLVVAPYAETGRTELTVAAVRTPGSRPGYLRSASTQRSGIVTLVDVAPTVLDTLGVSRPVDMEGRPFEAVASSASFDERRDRLVSLNSASRFRERLLFPTTLAIVVVLAGVAAATVVAIAGERSERARRAIAFVALADLAALPVSYVARGFPLEDLGAAFYWAVLVAGAVGVAAAATAASRRARSPRLGLVLVLVLVLAVLVGDVMSGSRLHLSAAFGYSPTGNSRLYGISNYSFAQLAASACLLAAFIAASWPSMRGRVGAVALMGAMLVVLGVPIWGSDVGGVLAFTPTILLFVALLARVRVRLRGLILGAIVTVAAVTAFGFVDLSRPADERAHLGRLFERIGNEGMQPLLSIVERKLLANLRVSTSSFWVAAIPIGIAFWLFLSRFPSRPLATLKDRIPTLHAALVAAAAAAVLGSLLNDSGAIVGGVTVMVVTASLAYLTLEPAAAAEVER